MAKMLPGEALIYERANGVVYARYRNPPHNTKPRWIVGGDPAGVSRAQGDLICYAEWQDLCRLAQEHATLKKQIDQLVTTYYLIKEQ